MKTTIDLPDDLVREIKIRAVRDRRKFKDLASDLLRKGLEVAPASPQKIARPIVKKDRKTGLPVIQCLRTPAEDPLTPDRVAEILLEQETEWARVSP